MSGDPATRFRENATEIASLVVTGLWLGLLLSGVGGSLWLAVMLIGYIVVIPIVALLYGDEEDIEEWWDEDELERIKLGEETERTEEADPSTRDALETLRDRYARGDLTDDQFEYKLEQLLGTETVEDADEWARGRGDARRARAPDRDLERE